MLESGKSHLQISEIEVRLNTQIKMYNIAFCQFLSKIRDNLNSDMASL